MPLFLSQRATEAQELMDDPDCSLPKLINTYKNFNTVNSFLSRWQKIYRSQIFPVCEKLDRPCTILDIGFGGGDIPIKLANWSKRDNLDVEITAIETDKRALDYVSQKKTPSNIQFRLISSAGLLNSSNGYDIVISNHLIHHLSTDAFYKILEESKNLSRHKVLFNDLERSDTAYFFFRFFSKFFFKNSFIPRDGPTSIRRSYTKKEMKSLVPDTWSVQRLFPCRLLLSYHHD